MSPKELAAHYEAKVFDTREAAEGAGLSPAACFAAAARAFASAIFAAFSKSDCIGLFVGSPTLGDAPPGGCSLSADVSIDAVDSSVAAGTVVPLVELPDGALPVSAAWLSGVAGVFVALRRVVVG